MKAPAFWSQTDAWQIRLLKPIARHYGALVQKRATRKPTYTSSLPVICVGNVTMGGSGKTPVVQVLTAMLQEHGKTPAVLLRGYGAKVKKPFWVMRNTPFQQCGDEALLHAQNASTLVSPDRAVGARIIEGDNEITHIVMDDGLQNPSLHKTLSFLVMDGGNPVGNGLLFPAGPLRETPDDAIKRVDAVIVLGEDRFHVAKQFGFVCPVFKARLRPVNGNAFFGKPVVAFAGIGRPDKFFDTLRALNVVPIETVSFADHHPYTAAEIERLKAKADAVGVPLVTTRKDWVRLSETLRERVSVLDVALQWDDVESVKMFLRDKKMI